jgi:multiple antibiotic resistance protein
MRALDRLVSDFILLLTIIDPVGSVPVFIAVAAHAPASMRRRIAIRAVVIAAGVLLFFLVLGQFLLETLSIDLAAFRIAGGIILFLFALDMIFGMSKPEAEMREAQRAGEAFHDLAVYPLAIPSISGPGSITAVIVLTDYHRFSAAEQALTALMVLAALIIVLACLLLADRIQRLIGTVGASIISRVMGLITAAIAADSVLSGIQDFFGLAAGATGGA